MITNLSRKLIKNHVRCFRRIENWNKLGWFYCFNNVLKFLSLCMNAN